MSPDNWQQIKDILGDALALAPKDRLAFLDIACGADAELRKEVEAFLEFENQEDSFLKKPAIDFPKTVFVENNLNQIIDRKIGNYKIVREIGSGGMGAIYLAERSDDEFQKQVAIKIIKRGMDTNEILRRFRTERQILADLDHPNIARLIDGGTTHDGLPYFVMEYIKGQPIDEYCDEQRLSITERLKLFHEVCSAVSYAHRQLVIHRDLKPSNILVTKEGVPKLLDFGIAKILRTDTGNETTEVTETIYRVMTPEYASPEQIKGDPITASSDVYSLGVMLYELLTGHRPYKLKSRRPEEFAKVICEEEPERPSTAISRIVEIVPTDPIKSERVTLEYLCQARSSAPEKLRHQLRGDLDNIVLMALRKEPQRRYVSVEEFSEDIHRHLNKLPVTACKDTLAYRTSKFFKRNFMMNRSRLLAPLIVSIILAGTAVVLTAYWISNNGESAAVNGAKSGQPRGLTINPQAFEAYQKGRYLWNKRTDEDHRKAIEYFNQAIAIEPNYAEAYAGLADVYAVLAQGLPKDERRDMIAKGRAAAQEAIKLDPALAEPHAALGFIAYDYDWNWEEAKREYKRAIELNPNYPTAHHWYAYLLQNIGRPDEAIAEIKRARELDPLSSSINRDVAEILFVARRYDEAIAELRKRLEVEPQDWRARDMLSDLLWTKGMRQESIAESQKTVELNQGNSYLLSKLAGKCQVEGRKAEAQKVLQKLRKRGFEDGGYEYQVTVRVEAGDYEMIFEMLEKHYTNRAGLITNLKVNPMYDAIRNDPRYEDLVRRIGLP